MKDYAVIRMQDIDLISFYEVEQSSKETVRKNLVKYKFIIKWTEINVPSIIFENNLTPLFVGNHAEIRQYLINNDSEWNEQII